MGNGSRYGRPDAIATDRRVERRRKVCGFSDCDEEVFLGLPVCFICAIQIGQFMRDLFVKSYESPEYGCELPPDHEAALSRFIEDSEAAEAMPAPPDPGPVKPTSVVYYLMLSPVTVKIGTTANLRKRIAQLRTELQYVIALEPGGRTLERERHIQFDDDRRNRRREDFHLSPALKRHIDTLTPRREEVLKLAWDTPM